MKKIEKRVKRKLVPFPNLMSNSVQVFESIAWISSLSAQYSETSSQLAPPGYPSTAVVTTV